MKNNKGFTLIEMAIVLVIIGLILGAVTKGKDVIESAKQKKVYTSFIRAWEMSVIAYRDRTGKLLGGTDEQPNAIHGEGGPKMKAIVEQLEAVGLEVPQTNTDNAWEYSYGGQTFYLYCRRNSAGQNYFYFGSMPIGLAIALDTMIDGEMDASSGLFRDSDATKAGSSEWIKKTGDLTPANTTHYYLNTY